MHESITITHINSELKRNLVSLGTDGQTALTAVFTIEVLSHEDTSTTGFTGAFLTQTGDLTVVINTVVLKDGELNLLALVLDLLGGGVSLLLLLFSTTTETEDQVKSGFLLNVIIGKGTAVFKLLTSENQTLLIRGNSYKFKEKIKRKE